jgi:hypothetical protein
MTKIDILLVIIAKNDKISFIMTFFEKEYANG